MSQKPKIRPVEAFPVEIQGRRMIALRDQAGLTDAQVIVSGEAFYILALLDGTNDVREIQASFMRKFGELLPSERVLEIVDKMENALLLEGTKFEAHRRAMLEAFQDSPVRPASLAGKAYPADAGELRASLEAHFDPPGGPGRPEEGTRAEPLRALIAPHIDFERGGAAYACAWKPAREGPAPDAVVILGTAHAGHSEGLFILTRKGFETPLGTAPSAEELVESLVKERGESLFDGEFTHAGEHSVEFQVIMSQLAFGDVPVLPVLVCSFHEFVVSGKEPFEDERVCGFVHALQGAVKASGKRVLYVVSADLAHVGPKFGDTGPADEAFLAGVRQSDMELLKRAGELDAPGFFGKIHRSADRTRVCGFPSIYTLIRLLEGMPLRGLMRRYGVAPDPAGSAVTFAAMSFEEGSCRPT